VRLARSDCSAFAICFSRDTNSRAAITVYVIGSAAGVQLLGKTGIAGRYTRGLAVISLVISLVVAPFIGWALAVSLIAVVGAFLYYTFVSPKGSVKWPS
jgi:hypothetical protein